MISAITAQKPKVDGYSPLTFEETPAVKRTGDPPPTLTDQRAIVTTATSRHLSRFFPGGEVPAVQVSGTASLSGIPMTTRLARPRPITRRMPFWELPTPAPADRWSVIISGIASVSCGSSQRVRNPSSLPQANVNDDLPASPPPALYPPHQT